MCNSKTTVSQEEKLSNDSDGNLVFLVARFFILTFEEKIYFFLLKIEQKKSSN